MPNSILYDGLNIFSRVGTGTATYARNLISVAQDAGYKPGVFCSIPNGSAAVAARADPDSLFSHSARPGRWARFLEKLQAQCYLFSDLPLAPLNVNYPIGPATKISDNIDIATGTWVFRRARLHFEANGSLATLSMAERPDIAHFTASLPLRVPGACNVYTIHDLVPLRVPNAIRRPRDEFCRLHLEIARKADHIVTVSERSKQDIVELLGVPENRVTNTSQSVRIPPFASKPENDIAAELRDRLSLTPGKYFLFYGAIEPKKNLVRLINAFLCSGLDLTLVVVGSSGWNNATELTILNDAQFRRSQRNEGRGPYLKHISFVDEETLTTLIRGARAVTFPSLYEGFGLPVLEAMLLGTPVLTSTTSSLPEVAGDAALLVDPNDVDAIRRGLVTLASDDGLRQELARRGTAQARKFDPARYREKVLALYTSLGFSAPSAAPALLCQCN